MTNQEILTKAITQAIAGGCKLFEIPKWAVKDEDGELYLGSLSKFEDQEWFSEDYEVLRYETIIFNHDFAKALWGEKNIHFKQYGVLENAWKVHLQQLVIADDPIKYLGDNL